MIAKFGGLIIRSLFGGLAMLGYEAIISKSAALAWGCIGSGLVVLDATLSD